MRAVNTASLLFFEWPLSAPFKVFTKSSIFVEANKWILQHRLQLHKGGELKWHKMGQHSSDPWLCLTAQPQHASQITQHSLKGDEYRVPTKHDPVEKEQCCILTDSRRFYNWLFFLIFAFLKYLHSRDPSFVFLIPKLWKVQAAKQITFLPTGFCLSQ